MQTSYNFGEKIAALAIVVLFSALGGGVVSLANGCEIPKIGRFQQLTVRPCIQGVRLPPLLGMIAFGCVACNFFGDWMEAFPAGWAQWIRGFIFSMMLVRSGLNLEVSRNGFQTIASLASFPLLFEATSFAIAGSGLFGMPIAVSYAMGFAIASSAPAVIVQQVTRLHRKGYGAGNNFPSVVAVTCPLENVINIVCFGICKTIAFQNAALDRGLTFEDEGTFATAGFILVQIGAAVVLGVLLGLFSSVFQRVSNQKLQMQLKFAYCISVAAGFMAASTFELPYSGRPRKFSNSPFIACLVFGLTTKTSWGVAKPTKLFEQSQYILNPCLFGSVGAALIFAKVRPGEFGKAIILIAIGLLCRAIGVWLGSARQGYSLKERLFLVGALSPKANAAATIGATILAEATQLGPAYSEYVDYGAQIQTTSIGAVVLTLVVGCCFIDSLGPRLLGQAPSEHQQNENATELTLSAPLVK